MKVKFGLLIGGEQPWVLAKDCVKLTIQAEKDGYDVAWIPDHLVDLDASRADPWSIFGYLSAVTKSISFCTAVTDFQKIHPSKLAQIVGTIDELSNGRVILGLGTGEAMNNTPFGVKWDDVKTRIARFEEYIKVIGKGDQERLVPITQEAIKYINLYKNKIRITGEISIDPKVGINLLILFKAGSVSLYVASRIEKTNLFCVLSILNATNQLRIAFIIIIHK